MRESRAALKIGILAGSDIHMREERGETIRVYTAGMTASQTTTFRTEEGKEVH